MKKIALEINGKKLKVYMADSFATRFRGLMLGFSAYGDRLADSSL